MHGSGAEYLASIFGTEKDKVNCSFYYKIGACRHGDRCSRVHNRPTFSQTLLVQNLYQNPALSSFTASGEVCNMSEIEMQEHYDSFFDEVYTEIEDKYGDIEEMNDRWFDGRPIYAELSPVSDFREACCRQYELG